MAEAKPQPIFSIQSVNDENIRKSSALNNNTTHIVEVKSASEKTYEGVVAARFFDVSSSLPQNWIGRQGYIVNSKAGSKDKILLVPYADASQTGGVISNWLKKTK